MFRNVGGSSLSFCDEVNAGCDTHVSGTIFAMFELGFAIVAPTLIAASVMGELERAVQ